MKPNDGLIWMLYIVLVLGVVEILAKVFRWT